MRKGINSYNNNNKGNPGFSYPSFPWDPKKGIVLHYCSVWFQF